MLQLNNKLKTILFVLLIWLYFFICYWLGGWVVEQISELRPITNPINASLFEPLVLLFNFVLIAIITRRILMALLLVTFMYAVFMFINIEMMNIFRLIFSPSDITHSLQVIFAKEVLISYWLHLATLVLLVFTFVLLIFKSKPNQLIVKYKLALMAVLLLVLTFIFFFKNEIALNIKNNFNLTGQAVPHIFAENHGFLFSFYYQLLKKNDLTRPKNYSKKVVEDLFTKYSEPFETNVSKKPDVIIFFIEAFADPYLVGIQTSRDPIPNFRETAQNSLSGFVVSPEIGGRSANPEFELLTGLSMRYVPEKSIPYIDYINSKYPSIVNEFRRNGYETNALHVASLSFFNYEKVYPLIGFDNIETLYGDPNVELDSVGRYPSENSLIDRIINVTSTQSKPQFIFAFPNSTHGFWDYSTYLDSDLEVLGEYLNNGKAFLKTYINAIHQADLAIHRLVEHYKNSDQPAIIMVLGDHQPSLPEFREVLTRRFNSNQDQNQQEFTSRVHKKRKYTKNILNKDSGLYLISHQVPYFIWSSESNNMATHDTSMNLLSTQLAKLAGIKLSPLYSLILKIHAEVGELSKSSQIDEAHWSTVNDYKMIQYDIMYGEKYYLTLTEK
jgi:phosphoglycerol transferase MdoB-like AlkP superfamily enzyme